MDENIQFQCTIRLWFLFVFLCVTRIDVYLKTVADIDSMSHIWACLYLRLKVSLLSVFHNFTVAFFFVSLRSLNAFAPKRVKASCRTYNEILSRKKLSQNGNTTTKLDEEKHREGATERVRARGRKRDEKVYGVITIRTTVQSPSVLYFCLWFFALHSSRQQKRRRNNIVDSSTFTDRSLCLFHVYLLHFSSFFLFVLLAVYAVAVVVSFRSLDCFLPSRLLVCLLCFALFSSVQFS